MNIHNRFRMIYFARVRSSSLIPTGTANAFPKSGQSLIEHSYKADSDLSPAGWEYAEKLREFVTERRASALEQRGYNPHERRLKVCPISWCFNTGPNRVPRFGLRRVVVLTIPLGLSHNYPIPPCLQTRRRLQTGPSPRPRPRSRSR